MLRCTGFENVIKTTIWKIHQISLQVVLFPLHFSFFQIRNLKDLPRPSRGVGPVFPISYKVGRASM